MIVSQRTVWQGFALLLVGLLPALGQQDSARRRTGNVCKIDTECPDNAWCRSVNVGTTGYCVCKDGFIIQPFNATHRECLKEATSVGEPCRSNIQCQSRLSVHAECAGGSCACKDGAHLDEGRCYETAVIGEKCSGTQNCYLGRDDVAEYQAFCVRGICTCQLSHSPRDSGTRCVKDAVLGEPCEDNEQCADASLQCSGGTCRCLDGWRVHPLESRCLQTVVELGGSCESDVQCESLGSAGAVECESGQCACGWGSRAALGRCWHSRRPGDDCTADQECLSEEGQPGYCRRGKCTCDTCQPDERDFTSVAASTRAVYTLPVVMMFFLLVAIRV